MSKTPKEFLLVPVSGKHPPIPINVEQTVVGRSPETLIQDVNCSRSQVCLKANLEERYVLVKPLGLNPSILNGVEMERNKGYEAKPGDVIELIPGLHRYTIELKYEKKSRSEAKPSAEESQESNPLGALLCEVPAGHNAHQGDDSFSLLRRDRSSIRARRKGKCFRRLTVGISSEDMSKTPKEFLLVPVSGKHPPIPINVEQTVVGRGPETLIQDVNCSRCQVSLKANLEERYVLVKPLGFNPSILNGVEMERNKGYEAKPGDVIELIPGLHRYTIELKYEKKSRSEAKPSAEERQESNPLGGKRWCKVFCHLLLMLLLSVGCSILYHHQRRL